MKIIFVRHPAADIAPGLCYGQTDIGLSAAGLASVDGLARSLCLHGATLIWSSPAQRCRVLADRVAAMARLPVRYHPGLLEIDFGTWEGRPWDDIPREALDRWAADPVAFAPPGGETGRALLDRVHAAWADISGAGKDCIVVTHGGPLRILSALARGQTPDLLSPAPAIGSVTVMRV